MKISSFFQLLYIKARVFDFNFGDFCPLVANYLFNLHTLFIETFSPNMQLRYLYKVLLFPSYSC